MSSLVRKCVFYKQKLTGKRVPHGTEIKFLKFNNILTDRAQRVDEKNGVIRLVIFTARVMVIKISKMARLMYFLPDTAKYQSQFGQARYLNASERSYLALSENTMDYVLRSSH